MTEDPKIWERVTVPVYECPKHGPVTAVMFIYIEGEEDTRFCMYCLREKLFECGLQPLGESSGEMSISG
jgi:hypothetical protein